MAKLSLIAKSLIYQTLDIVTSKRGIPRVIGGERIYFPPAWSRYYEPDYETVTFDFLREHCRPGDTVLDIGAHIGLFTVLIARLVSPNGRVFSFEPTPFTRDVLKRTVTINECNAVVDVRAEALSDSSGTATFFDTGDTISNANSLVKTERHAGGFCVTTLTVDDFVSGHNLQVRCLKVDVEGAEFQVLLGARQTMIKQRPAISLALHPSAINGSGGSLEKIWATLQEYRYEVSHNTILIDSTWFVTQEGLFDVQCIPIQ